MITLQPHERHRAPVFADSAPSGGWRALDAARAEFTLCNHYSHRRGDEPRVQVMSAGGYGGDPLDESNEVTLRSMADAWRDDERCGVDGDELDVDYHPGAGNGSSWVSVCVAPDRIDLELLGEIIAAAESFADHPVLDESDYSQRESDAWDDALDWGLRDWPEESHDALRRAVGEAWSGYAEPGYVAAEWVTVTARALGLTRRRVRLDGQRPYQADRVDVLGRDRDGELAWHPLGRIFNGAVRP